jgi:hypothetical protein
MTLPDRISRYINRCEPALSGEHGHDSTFAVAIKLTWGFALSVEAAWPFMLGYNSRCKPRWCERDLLRKLNQALTHHGHTKPRGYLLGEAVNYYIPPSTALPKLEQAWPRPDLAKIDRIVSGGPGLCDLWESSPVRFADNGSHAEEVIDILFPGNPLLCVGRSSYQFATRRREIWGGRLSELPLIVPNPMLSVTGQTQDGRQSEHTKSATAKRVYQVVEFDFPEKDKSGKETLWVPLLHKWRSSETEIADACASLILFLRQLLPTLVCACHSGRRSLHGWFRVFELTPAARKAFMKRAVALGADRATWVESQFVRIPDGLRDNGRRQTCYFLDPNEGVKA